MPTKAEIRQRVGEDLGLVPIGQSLEAPDVARVDAAIDEVYSQLKLEGVATWKSTGSVPTAAAPFFILMVLETLLTTYSVSDARYQRIKMDAGSGGVTALKNISRVTTNHHDDTELPQDF